ncbi:hypothetical protein [Helicobacter cetorum]|uniref:hypothetical protein n=1 Tax=Helicobacter cetorum TaxID=138563 RepID=UPI000CF0BE2A|nr:hypothetical protein [Helicobacter cetorum]
MNTSRFIRNFLIFRDALNAPNFNNKELNELCLKSAIECEQISLQEQAQNLAKEQARAKIELDFLNTISALNAQKAQTLNTLIQCQSMLKSLKDNAMINRANAYVSLLQVKANGGTNIGPENFKNVLEVINQIGLDYQNSSVSASANIEYDKTKKPQSELDKLLNKLSKELDKLNEQELDHQIQIFANELETIQGVPITLWGFSTLKNANEGFYYNDELLASGNTCLFESKDLGKAVITFKAHNEQESLEKRITLNVVSDKIKK